MDWSDVDWGDVPTWLAGLAALVLLWAGLREYRRSIGDREREQASRIAVWTASYKYKSAVGHDDTADATVEVHNGSDLPIYDVNVRLLPWDWRQRPLGIRLDGRLYGVIKPNFTTTPQDIDGGLVHPPVEVKVIVPSPPYEIEFTDNAGVRWLRRPDGDLRKLDASIDGVRVDS